MFFKKSLFFVLILTLFFSSVYSVVYYPPTPENNARLSNQTISIIVFDEGDNLVNCNFVFNSINYNVPYEDGFCRLELEDFPIVVKDYTFQAFYNNSNNALSERTFRYYPSAAEIQQVPLLSISSYVIFILTIIGGLILINRRKW